MPPQVIGRKTSLITSNFKGQLKVKASRGVFGTKYNNKEGTSLRYRKSILAVSHAAEKFTQVLY